MPYSNSHVLLSHSDSKQESGSIQTYFINHSTLGSIHSGIFHESELIASHEWDNSLIVSDEISQRLTPVSPSTKTPIIEAYMPTF